MVDVHTTEQRSRNMAAIRGKDTKPEICVRTLLHSLGYRFRLHRKDLPGKPDIVLPRHKAVIFVHGCFWHCHNCRFGRVQPVTRSEFWTVKRQSNVDRDHRNKTALRALGWHVMVIWECETKRLEKIEARLTNYLAEKRPYHQKRRA
jgi:DNA mismatch endonuclease (patch repair protein)